MLLDFDKFFDEGEKRIPVERLPMSGSAKVRGCNQ